MSKGFMYWTKGNLKKINRDVKGHAGGCTGFSLGNFKSIKLFPDASITL